MRLKKLVGAIVALAMLVSAFAGLSASAEIIRWAPTAADLVALEDWTVTTSDDTWVTPSGYGDRASASAVLPTTITDELVRIKFDTKHAAYGGGVAFQDSNGNPLVKANYDNGSYKFTINSVEPDISFSRGNIIDVDLIVDLTTDTIIKATITNETASKVDTTSLVGVALLTSTVDDIGKIVLSPRSGKYKVNGNVSVANISLAALAVPAFTLAADTANAAVGGTATVDVTDVTGIIEVTSADSTIATGSYEEGVLTVNGVSEGVTTLTLTATNDGLTTSQDVTVLVGDVENATLVINYYLTGRTESVPTLASTSIAVAVGDVIEADTITTADVLTDTDQYVYNSVSVEFPYTIVSGENVINVYYDQLDKYTGKAIASIDGAADESVVFASYTDLIAGNTFKYSYSKYLTDENHKVTAATTETTYTKTVTPTEDTVYTVDYTTYDGVAYFAEESVFSNNADQGSTKFSGGTSRRAEDAGAAAFTIAEEGNYTIEIVTACRNTSNSSKFAVYKNSVDEANLLLSGDAKGHSYNVPYVCTTTEVPLHTGDVIIVQGDSGQTWVDYILAERTGDYMEYRTETYTFNGLALNDASNYNLKISYGEKSADSETINATETTKGIVISNLLNGTTYEGEGTFQFTLEITMIDENTEIGKVWVESPVTNALFLAAGEIEEDAVIDEDQLIMEDVEFEVE